MARYGYGMSVSGSRTAVVASSGGGFITTSRAFNSSGVQVGTTNTGAIPANWVANEATVASVIFANDNSVTSIGSSAFSYCTGLTSVTMPNSVTIIDTAAFRSSGLTSVTIPNGVTNIGSEAFYECYGLSSITIPNSVTSIGGYAFKNCTSLATVTFTATSSVTSIGNYAFSNTALTSITIPNSVTSIGSYAFRDSSALATVLCYVAQSAFTGTDAFDATSSPLVIQARITDASWTAGVGLVFQGNTNVTVIKNL